MVSACGTNFSAQTNQPYQPAEGANADSDKVKVLNAVAVANSDDTATLSASLITEAADADSLTGVTGTDGEGQPLDVTLDEPIELSPDAFVKTGEEPQVVLSLNETGPGYYVTLDFEFENAAPLEMDVPVVERGDEGMYDEIAEAPEPAPSPNKNNGKKSDSN